MLKDIKKEKGFTLIELLIVIAVIAIIAAVVFVALDPLKRFQEARDSSRWSDVSALISAIKIDQVDNGGRYLADIASTTSAQVYMIGDATTCVAGSFSCDVLTTASECLDLTPLVSEGYIGAVPVSPNGEGLWTASTTGYTLQRDSGIITIRSCESEGGGGEIFIVR